MIYGPDDKPISRPRLRKALRVLGIIAVLTAIWFFLVFSGLIDRWVD